MTSCAIFIICCWVTMLYWMFGTDFRNKWANLSLRAFPYGKTPLAHDTFERFIPACRKGPRLCDWQKKWASSRQSSISVSSHFAFLLHRSSVASIHHQRHFSPQNWPILFKNLIHRIYWTVILVFMSNRAVGGVFTWKKCTETECATSKHFDSSRKNRITVKFLSLIYHWLEKSYSEDEYWVWIQGTFCLLFLSSNYRDWSPFWFKTQSFWR